MDHQLCTDPHPQHTSSYCTFVYVSRVEFQLEMDMHLKNVTAEHHSALQH